MDSDSNGCVRQRQDDDRRATGGAAELRIRRCGRVHSEANKKKMHEGHPLTDDDRWPWLRSIRAAIEAKREAGLDFVFACSALKGFVPDDPARRRQGRDLRLSARHARSPRGPARRAQEPFLRSLAAAKPARHTRAAERGRSDLRRYRPASRTDRRRDAREGPAAGLSGHRRVQWRLDLRCRNPGCLLSNSSPRARAASKRRLRPSCAKSACMRPSRSAPRVPGGVHFAGEWGGRHGRQPALAHREPRAVEDRTASLSQRARHLRVRARATLGALVHGEPDLAHRRDGDQVAAQEPRVHDAQGQGRGCATACAIRRGRVRTSIPPSRTCASSCSSRRPIARSISTPSGEPLFKRGWRLDKGAAPLRENLAAGILRLTGWTPGTPALRPDVRQRQPSCRSGPAGARRGARRAAALRFREAQAIRHHRLGSRSRVAALDKQRAARGARVDDLRIFGSDISGDMLEKARSNLARAGVPSLSLKQLDARNMVAPVDVPGILVANPPYGERIEVRGRGRAAKRGRRRAASASRRAAAGAANPASSRAAVAGGHRDRNGDEGDAGRGFERAESEELGAEFFQAFGDALKQRFTGWHAFMLSSDRGLPGQVAPARVDQDAAVQRCARMPAVPLRPDRGFGPAARAGSLTAERSSMGEPNAMARQRAEAIATEAVAGRIGIDAVEPVLRLGSNG